MTKKPVVRVEAQTANCTEVYIGKVRITACINDEGYEHISLELNGQILEVKP